MDERARILGRLRCRVDEMALQTVESIIEEVAAFGPVRDAFLRDELLALATSGIALLVDVMTRSRPPTGDELAFIRDRARQRARQLVPLSALLHAYLIANRVVLATIADEVREDAASARGGLQLTALASEYTLLTTTAMADAYVESVQGHLADLERQRRELLDALLAGRVSASLVRTAAGLGIEPGRPHVVAVAAVVAGEDSGQDSAQRWTAEAIAGAAGRPERHTFVISHGREVVSALPVSSPAGAIAILESAAGVLAKVRGLAVVAGVGPAFTDLGGLPGSYAEARRALRHASRTRPFVVGPAGVRLADELALTADRDIMSLIADPTRAVLEDATLRATVDAFAAANLNVATAAQSLFIHPNTLRYRLRRIAERTGHDPFELGGLVELTTASAVLRAGGA